MMYRRVLIFPDGDLLYVCILWYVILYISGRCCMLSFICNNLFLFARTFSSLFAFCIPGTWYMNTWAVGRRQREMAG